MSRAVPMVSMLLLIACSGGKGCSGSGGLSPIAGGFPSAQRQENAIELRLTQDLFTFVQQNGAGLINQLLGGGKIAVPSGCTGDTQVCCGQMCTLNATASGLAFTPAPPKTMSLGLRARLQTNEYLHIKYKKGLINFDCGVSYDSTRKDPADVGLKVDLLASVDAPTQLTSLDFKNISIQDLQPEDVDIKGPDGKFDLTCAAADLLKGLVINTLKDQLVKQLSAPLAGALCRKCQTEGSKDECVGLATCTNKVCQNGASCLEFLGIEGRVDLSGLLGKQAGLDLHLAAGGYAQVEDKGAGGLSLGMLGGALGDPPSSCVPVRPPPMAATPARAPEYSGGAAPNGMPYHLGAGISTQELDLLGHGFYSSGALCLSISSALLSSGTLGKLIQSLPDLSRGQDAAMNVVLRPQQAPTFTLGKGTFKTDGMGHRTIDDPLLTIGLTDFAIDFYLYMDQRYVRVMRMLADVKVPLSLDVDGMGQLLPILGDLGHAVQNLRVSDTPLLSQTPQSLAALFTSLVSVALGQIAPSIKPIALPSLMGFDLLPVQITSTPDMQGKPSFLGLFLELKLAKGMARTAETTASLISLDVPSIGQMQAGQGPHALLRVDALHDEGGPLEWQIAVDGGLWRPFDDRHEVLVDDPALGLPGRHYVDVRARVAGQVRTLDPTPARVEFEVAAGLPAAGATAGGCSAVGHGSGGAVLLLLPFLLLLLRRRPGVLSLLLLLGLSPACSSPDAPMMPPGQFAATDEIGRYQSAAASGDTIYVSAYNSSRGDLAFATVSDPQAKLSWQLVDGVVDRPLQDGTHGVGLFTSLALSSKGTPLIAYQDVDAGAVKLAIGPPGSWQISVLDTPADGSKLGLFTQLSLSSDDVPTVAYMATGVPKDDKVVAQLILSQAKSASPAGPGDWTRQVVDEAATSCAGLCGAGKACVYTDAMKKDRLLAVCKPVMTCTPACGKNMACIAGACVDAVPVLPQDVPEGTGLYARFLRGGRAGQLLFYNRTKGSLSLCAGPGWKPVVIAGGDGKVDVGQHIGAQAAGDGTLHVAYVDAAASQLLYRTIKGGTAGPVEVIDDGSRGGADGRESHRVGAGAVLFLNGDAPMVAYQDQTTGTLELAQRGQAMGMSTPWTHLTKAPGGTRFRGFYPQAVPQASGKWILLDVVYDRARDGGLSAVEFSPL